MRLSPKGVKGKLEMEERFMKRNEPIPKKKEFLQILREYEPYDKDHYVPSIGIQEEMQSKADTKTYWKLVCWQ